MNFAKLSVEDQELVRAFFEIAREECGLLSWAEIEPTLAACWNRTHRRSSELKWDDISRYVRDACNLMSR
jgi:hypothetical protein